MRSRMTVPAVVGALILLTLLQSCAGARPGLEKPGVKVESLQVLDSKGLSQRFRIGLVLTNPNSTALPVDGISYTLSLNGADLLSGVSDQIPTLAAYSETPVSLDVSADLFAALRLLNSLTRAGEDELEYSLAAKIDLAGWRPSFNVQREGQIDLRQLR